MIRCRIQIDGGVIADTLDGFGMIYLKSDKRFAPDEKECDTVSYAGEEGEDTDPRTVAAPFDYNVEFLIEALGKDLGNVNAKVQAFNAAIRKAVPGSDIRRKLEVAFYNDIDHVKIVGYPELLAQPEDVYRSRRYGELEFAVVKLTIHVAKPSKCDFNIPPVFRQYTGKDLMVGWYGLHNSNSRIYYSDSKYGRCLEARVQTGDRIRLRCMSQDNAVPYILGDAAGNRNVLYFESGENGEHEYNFIAEYPAILYANWYPYTDQDRFMLEIDQRPQKDDAGIMETINDPIHHDPAN